MNERIERIENPEKAEEMARASKEDRESGKAWSAVYAEEKEKVAGIKFDLRELSREQLESKLALLKNEEEAINKSFGAFVGAQTAKERLKDLKSQDRLKEISLEEKAIQEKLKELQ